MAKRCEQNMKMLAKKLFYVPRYVGLCQLSKWDRPEDVTKVASPL